MIVTLTDEQYVEAVEAVKSGARIGTLLVDSWCDGAACRVEPNTHGAWRHRLDGYAVDGTEVVLRLINENAQLKEALAALLPRHSSWCMGHMGGVKDGVGVGPLVVVDCRCEPNVQRARALLGK